MDHLAEELGVRPVAVPGLQRELGWHDLRALWHTVRWTRKYRPDIVHTHTAKAGAIGRLAVLFAGLDRPPVVVHTFHGHVFQGEFSPRRSRLFARIERFLARRATCVVAVSEEVRKDLIELGVASPDRVEVVKLGFDLAPFDVRGPRREDIRQGVRARLGIPANAPVVSVIARVVKIKRIDRFLEMAAALPGDVWFIVAGDGDRRAELERSEIARSLAPRIVWAGFERDIPGICLASDVVALTSDNEGTPVCLIEAQAASVPVVSTRVGGVETVVADGETGYVVEPDPRQLAEAVARILAEEGLSERLGSAGRERSFGLFSVERLVADIDELYRRLLQEARPSRNGARA